MSGTAAIAIVVVVWLFVLAPLVLRGHKPIRRTSKAFDETRVVYEGDTEIPEPNRPTFTKKDVRFTADTPATTEDIEVVEVSEDDILIDDSPRTVTADADAAAGDSAEAFSDRDEHSTSEELDELEGVVVTDDDEAEVAATDDASVDEPVAYSDPVAEPNDDLAQDDPQDYYDIKSYYAQAGDSLHPRAIDEGIDDSAQSQDTTDAPADDAEYLDEPEASPEDQQFVAQHPGRGWYNPEADAHRASTRYQRRQRTLIVLVALVAIGLALGFGFGGAWWYVAAGAMAVAVLYLVELRRQVRREKELRRRRMHNLRRARLGVRRGGTEDDALVPPRLRHPGAIVLELDDESPDFEYLETRYVDTEAYDDYVDEVPARSRYATTAARGRGYYDYDQDADDAYWTERRVG